MIVPSPPSPPAEPLLGLSTPAACVTPHPLLFVAVAFAIVVVVVVVVFVVVIVIVIVVVVVPTLPPTNALPSSSSLSMAGMVAPTDRCCVQEVKVNKQLQRRCNDGRNRSTGDTAVTVHAGSHGTTVLWCTW